MPYVAAENRYDTMIYRCAGRAGLLLPTLSLWLGITLADTTSTKPTAKLRAGRLTGAYPL